MKILNLTTTEVKGSFELTVTSNFNSPGAVLEINEGQGWQPLSETPVTVKIDQNHSKTWPLRLRVGKCPEGNPPDKSFTITVESINAEGQTISTTIPVKVVIQKDPWIVCWWPVIATVAGILATLFVVYGFISPSRFPPRLGVVLSPEEEMSEGFFHPIRAERGTGIGFYRNARVHICHDFRLSPNSSNALATLKAHGKQTLIQPASGNTLWRQNAEGEWEKLPQEESPARIGTVYKNDLGTMFFEIRNG